MVEDTYRLFSYHLVQAGIEHAALSVLSISLSAGLIGSGIRQTRLLLTIGVSVPVGAAIFCLLYTGPLKGVLVGSLMVTWAYAGSALALGLRRWKILGLFWKGYMIVVIVSVLSLPWETTAIAGSQFASFLIGFSFAFFQKAGPTESAA